MYIKSIIIDGFKSYGQRTEINGFDPEFNAITGLNGSGKSNILDAICFVLGITNLQQVRAGSLQELVYKNGQAGVNKASVSIKFNNSDPNSRPVGYENHGEIIVTRQVVIGGKNKYLLNGTNVQNKRIQDLFCSVQMNVNNPHFLIMQGRITKVLNMKPPEILLMIEEAAGTRMYEAKRQSSQKLIEKKDAKLAQLNEVIDEEIKPKLNKLREEKGQYVEYQKVLRELDSQTRIYNAYKYVTLVETSQLTSSTLKRMQNEIVAWKEQITAGEKELKELDERVEELHKKRDEETGGKLEELEKELKAKEKLEAQASSALKALKDSITSEKKKKQQLEKNLKEDEAALKTKETELSKMKGIFDKLKSAEAADADALAAAQQKFQAVSSGLLADEDGKQATLQEQLMKAREQSARAQDELKQAQMQLQHSQNELKAKEKEMKATSTDYLATKKKYDGLEVEVKNIQNQLKKIQYEEGSLEAVQQERNKLCNEIRTIKDSVDRIEARNPHLTFRYKDPFPNFNRSSVKGLVCQQFKVKDPTHFAALQQAAGGRLYFVIVDTDKTGKDIVMKGQLTNRVNMIPLNKITARSLDQHTIKVATDLVGKENVYPALSLIEYRPEVHKAMEFVFGDLFVCRDMKAAMTVAFDKRVFKKCVTLSGDMADPSGTMSGGAAAKGQPVLSVVSELIELQEQLKTKTANLSNLDKKLAAIQAQADKYINLKENFDLKQHELEMVRTRLHQSEQHQHEEEINALKVQIQELGEKLIDCKKLSSEGDKKAKEVEKKILNAKEIQQKELKAAEQEMARLKKQAAASREQWLQRQQESESLDLEICELKKSIESGHDQIQTSEKTLEDLNTQSQEQQQAVTEAKAVVRTNHEQVKAMKEMINQKNRDIHSIVTKKEKIVKERGELELEMKKAEHEISKLQSEHKEAVQSIDAMLEKYSWISTDKQYFGKQGIYNFKDYDMANLGNRLVELRELKDKLGRTVNTRAMNMLEQQEDECGDLINKKIIVEKDKAKIMEVIRELDEKKKVALRRACDQVNKDFGSIFSSLLPGAQAKLQPLEGKDVLEGLEVKVGFSNVWKDSLGELSGGQRSLVALSLILAMLLFKPAPIYILDEVDAALDLSHTQNIGNMLKKHFRHSQFIIVSLKDGMFSNANVLFRTQFKDGMSTVTRTVQAS